MSLTAGAGTRCMSLLPDSPTLLNPILYVEVKNQGVNLLCREGNSQPGHWRTDPLFLNLRSSEIHLFYNLGDFYWHFLEILWLFIFLFLYSG